MAMVEVGLVRVLVGHGRVPVDMGMPTGGRYGTMVVVVVMVVVPVGMQVTTGSCR